MKLNLNFNVGFPFYYLLKFILTTGRLFSWHFKIRPGPIPPPPVPHLFTWTLSAWKMHVKFSFAAKTWRLQVTHLLSFQFRHKLVKIIINKQTIIYGRKLYRSRNFYCRTVILPQPFIAIQMGIGWNKSAPSISQYFWLR